MKGELKRLVNVDILGVLLGFRRDEMLQRKFISLEEYERRERKIGKILKRK